MSDTLFRGQDVSTVMTTKIRMKSLMRGCKMDFNGQGSGVTSAVVEGVESRAGNRVATDEWAETR